MRCAAQARTINFGAYATVESYGCAAATPSVAATLHLCLSRVLSVPPHPPPLCTSPVPPASAHRYVGEDSKVHLDMRVAHSQGEYRRKLEARAAPLHPPHATHAAPPSSAHTRARAHTRAPMHATHCRSMWVPAQVAGVALVVAIGVALGLIGCFIIAATALLHAAARRARARPSPAQRGHPLPPSREGLFSFP